MLTLEVRLDCGSQAMLSGDRPTRTHDGGGFLLMGVGAGRAQRLVAPVRRAQAAGRGAVRIGERMAEKPVLDERSWGAALMVRGAELLEDSGRKAQAQVRAQQAKAQGEAIASATLERWPLPSLWEDAFARSLYDPEAYLRAFLEPAPEATP